MSWSDLARRASIARRWAGVYSSSAVGKPERSITIFGVRTILPLSTEASTKSPSATPMAERRRLGRVICPLRWIFTRVVILAIRILIVRKSECPTFALSIDVDSGAVKSRGADLHRYSNRDYWLRQADKSKPPL